MPFARAVAGRPTSQASAPNRSPVPPPGGVAPERQYSWYAQVAARPAATAKGKPPGRRLQIGTMAIAWIEPNRSSPAPPRATPQRITRSPTPPVEPRIILQVACSRRVSGDSPFGRLAPGIILLILAGRPARPPMDRPAGQCLPPNGDSNDHHHQDQGPRGPTARDPRSFRHPLRQRSAPLHQERPAGGA